MDRPRLSTTRVLRPPEIEALIQAVAFAMRQGQISERVGEHLITDLTRASQVRLIFPPSGLRSQERRGMGDNPPKDPSDPRKTLCGADDAGEARDH